MLTKFFLTPLLMLSLSSSMLGQTVTIPQADDIKSQIDLIGIGEIVTIYHLKGKKFIGRISRIGETDFEMADIGEEMTFTIQYDEVKAVKREIDFGYTKIRVGGDRSTTATTDSRGEDMRILINNLGLESLITISHINGKRYHGIISRIGTTEFEIADHDEGKTFIIQYREVKKIQDPWQSYHSSRRTVLIITIATLAAIPIIYLIVRPKVRQEPSGFPRFP